MITPRYRTLNKSRGITRQRQDGKVNRNAVLGDGNGNIYVGKDTAYYYFRFVESEKSDGDTEYSAPSVVLSNAAPIILQDGFPITIGYKGTKAIVKEPSAERLIERGINPSITNWLNPWNKFIDPFFNIFGWAGRVGTTNTPTLEVWVKPFYFIDDTGAYIIVSDAQIDLVSYIPAADGDGNPQHLLAGIFVDSAGAFEVITSTAKLTEEMLSHSADVAELHTKSTPRSSGLRAFRLYTGQTLIKDEDVFTDLRLWLPTPRRKNNFAATAAPTVNDDIDTGVGYEVGSWWFDVTNNDVYYCIDSTSGAAIWHKVTTTALTRTTAATYNVVTGDTEIFANTDINAVTVNLQAGVQNRKLRIINTGSSGASVTIAPNGAEHLIGLNNGFVLLDGESMIITYDTTDGWY